ncbi:uncharacterized protein LOC124355431 [Homalodisca vitripennis]|uniref:uncharacterized protein LOC124355431 n=1 Tax=Homalodisca vitripennis TaxID=197043 RepID=UPI001EEC94D9|nr:uncharacterized protein LOC124355431 [Homalodisca vitripennis]
MRGFVFIITAFNSMILLFFLNSVISETRSPRVLSDEDPTTQPVFTSLQEVLDLLESEKFRNLLPVQQLLFAYFNICQSKRISYLPKPIRQPFIVVEGNHRTAKRMLAMRLSRRIGASLFHNPPRCLSSLRNFFPTGSLYWFSTVAAKRMLAMRLSRRIGASLFHNPPRCLSSLRNFFPTGSLYWFSTVAAKRMLAMRLSRRIGASLFHNPPRCLSSLRNFFPTGSLYWFSTVAAKRMLAMRLSRRIGASLFHNPPRCLSSLRNFFPTGSLYWFSTVAAKRMLAMRLSRRIGASLFHNPPRCLSSLRNFFPTGSLLLRAYFKLCAYALAQATRRLINIFPVILNGYWLEQQTYAIARTYGSDPPPADHPVYRWPNNLLKPDLIFFIEFPDNLHKEILTTRPPNAHKTLAMNALLKMNIPNLVVINTTRGHDIALQEMERHIIDRLGLTFPIRWLNTTRGPSRIHLRNIRVKKV